MFTFPFGEQVTRRRFSAGAPDRYGNPTRVPVDTVLPQLAAFNPGASEEPLEADRASVELSPSLYFTDSPDVRADDELCVRGEWYLVDGAPLIYASPFDGDTGGSHIRLKRVNG